MLLVICIGLKAILQSRGREAIKEYIEYAVKFTNYDESTILKQIASSTEIVADVRKQVGNEPVKRCGDADVGMHVKGRSAA